jgi:hypothetical protein
MSSFEDWLGSQREQITHLFKDPAATDVAYLNGRLQMLKEVEAHYDLARARQDTVTVEIGPSDAVVYSTIPPGGGGGLGPDAYNSAGEQSRKATREEVMTAFKDVVARQGPVFDKLAEIEAAENGPQKPAAGKNGHWVRLGEVCVDSSQVVIVDPAYTVEGPNKASRFMRENDELAGIYNRVGVQMCAGFGDGGYWVEAWVVDYGEGDEVDERIAAIWVTFINDEDLAGWRAD